MSRVKAQSIALIETRALYAVGGVFLILLALYTYLVIGTILEVVLRQELEVSIKEKSSSMALLESNYLQKTRDIDAGYARENGFVPLAEEEYVAPNKLSHAITSFAP